MPLISKPTHALILAAGFGKRLLPITETTPKALVEIGGISMLERAVHIIKDAGIHNIHINTHYLADQIHSRIEQLKVTMPEINFFISYEPEILDTGGGIAKVLNEHNLDTIITFNPDIMYTSGKNPVKVVLDACENCTGDALIGLIPRKEFTPLPKEADFQINYNNRLVRCEDKILHTHVFTGIGVYRRDKLSQVKKQQYGIMSDYVIPKIDINIFQTVSIPATAYDIGTIHQYNKALILFS